jgi:hypothetical protein
MTLGATAFSNDHSVLSVTASQTPLEKMMILSPNDN